ncbi:Guanylate kinase [Diplonema papillatum]|nr:Guanylate kinase [Diplonema papillatum]
MQQRCYACGCTCAAVKATDSRLVSPVKPFTFDEREAYAEPGSAEYSKIPVIICGPMGVGKTALLQRLVADCSSRVKACVSVTTRRPESALLTKYQHVDKATMRMMIDNDQFFQCYKRPVGGEYYAVTKAEIESIQGQNLTPVLDLDHRAIKPLLRKNRGRLRFVYLTATEDELKSRLGQSNLMKRVSRQDMQDALTSASNDQVLEYVKDSLCKPEDLVTVPNRDFDVSYEILKTFVLTGEHVSMEVAAEKLEAPSPLHGVTIVVEPSGMGGSKLINRLREHSDVGVAVSHTTRAKKPDEEDGKHYHFVSVEEFRRKHINGEFLEFARVGNHFYGITKEEFKRLLSHHKKVVIKVNVSGARYIQSVRIGARFVLLTGNVPSEAELRHRWESAGAITDKEMERKKTALQNDLRDLPEVPFYFNLVLDINDEKTCYAQLRSFILSGHKEEILAQIPGRLAPPEEADQILFQRGGLLKKAAMKSDHFPSGKVRWGLDGDIPGAPNFRCVTEGPDPFDLGRGHAFYGVAQPTVDGFRQIFMRALRGLPPKTKILVVNLREEMVMYVNERPFCLKNLEDLYHNMSDEYIDGQELDKREKNLRLQILAEAKKNGDSFLVHDEEYRAGGLAEFGEIYSYWESVQAPSSVLTVSMVLESLKNEEFNLQYLRLPITDEHPPTTEDLDTLTDVLWKLHRESPKSPIIFNCQLGRGRTTTATLLSLLFLFPSSSDGGEVHASSNDGRDIHELDDEEEEYEASEKTNDLLAPIDSFGGDPPLSEAELGMQPPPDDKAFAGALYPHRGLPHPTLTAQTLPSLIYQKQSTPDDHPLPPPPKPHTSPNNAPRPLSSAGSRPTSSPRPIIRPPDICDQSSAVGSFTLNHRHPRSPPMGPSPHNLSPPVFGDGVNNLRNLREEERWQCVRLLFSDYNVPRWLQIHFRKIINVTSHVQNLRTCVSDAIAKCETEDNPHRKRKAWHKFKNYLKRYYYLAMAVTYFQTSSVGEYASWRRIVEQAPAPEAKILPAASQEESSEMVSPKICDGTLYTPQTLQLRQNPSEATPDPPPQPRPGFGGNGNAHGPSHDRDDANDSFLASPANPDEAGASAQKLRTPFQSGSPLVHTQSNMGGKEAPLECTFAFWVYTNRLWSYLNDEIQEMHRRIKPPEPYTPIQDDDSGFEQHGKLTVTTRYVVESEKDRKRYNIPKHLLLKTLPDAASGSRIAFWAHRREDHVQQITMLSPEATPKTPYAREVPAHAADMFPLCLDAVPSKQGGLLPRFTPFYDPATPKPASNSGSLNANPDPSLSTSSPGNTLAHLNIGLVLYKTNEWAPLCAAYLLFKHIPSAFYKAVHSSENLSPDDLQCKSALGDNKKAIVLLDNERDVDYRRLVALGDRLIVIVNPRGPSDTLVEECHRYLEAESGRTIDLPPKAVILCKAFGAVGCEPDPAAEEWVANVEGASFTEHLRYLPGQTPTTFAELSRLLSDKFSLD